MVEEIKTHKLKTYNILFYGIGGQGILKASELSGQAALLSGFHVEKSEVHGMAQRGGSVESHLRFGKRVFSPLIPKGEADFLVPFYEGEYGRLKNFLKHKGIDLIFSLRKAEKELADKRFINTYIVGVLSLYLPIKEKDWIKAIDIVFKGRMVNENRSILLKARKLNLKRGG